MRYAQKRGLGKLSLFVLLASMVSALGHASERPNQPVPYELSLYNVHTGERLNVVYRRGGQYIPSAVSQLDLFLRDRRTQNVYRLDPRLFDLLHDVVAATGHPKREIDIICGYRSDWSNNYLRRTTGGVAQHSLHVKGEAIDIRIPGVPTRQLRDAALRLHRGGVGYYPNSQFVHVDVGRVRQWRYPQR